MGGRPKALDESQVKVAIALAEAGELTIKEICEQVGAFCMCAEQSSALLAR